MQIIDSNGKKIANPFGNDNNKNNGNDIHNVPRRFNKYHT